MISKNKKAALVTVSATLAISAIAAPIIWHILHSKKEKETDYKKISELDQKILFLDKDIKINNDKKSEIKNKMDDVENELNELKQVVSLLTGKSIEDKEVFKNNEDYILDFSNVNEGSLLYPLLLKQAELKKFIKNAKITKTNLLEEIEKLTNYYRNTKEELKNELNLLKNEEIELRKEKNRIITKQKYMTAMYKAEILTLESQIAVLNQKYSDEEKRYKELVTELNQSIQSLEEENRSLNSELTSTINLLNQTNLTINKLFEKLKEVLLKQKEANSIFKIVNDTYVSKNLTNLIITNDIEIDNALNSDSLQTVQNLVLLLSDNFSKNIRRINENHKTIQTPILNKNLEYVEKLNILLGTSDTYEIGENGSSALEGSLVYDLRQQAHDLELELQELQNNKLNLESRKNELEPVLSSTEGTNSELIRNLQQLNESFSQKNEEINNLNEELRVLNNENTSLQQKIDNYKSMLIRLIGTDSQEFNFDNLAKAAQQGIVKDLHDKIAALEASKLESLERLEQEKEQLEQEKNRLNEELNSTNSNLATKVGTISTLNNRLETLRHDEEANREEIAKVREQIQRVENEKNSLEQEKQSKEEAINRLNDQIDEKNQQIAILEEKERNLESQKERKNSLEQEKLRLETNLSDTIRQKESAQESLNEANNLFNQKQTELQNLNRDLQSENLNKERLEQEKEQLERDIEQLTDETNNSDSENERLRKELNQKQSTLNQKTKELEKTIEKIDELRNALSNLNSQLVSLEENINNKTQEKNSLETRKSELERLISTIDNEIQNLSDSNATLSNENSNLNNQLAQMKDSIKEKQAALALLNEQISSNEQLVSDKNIEIQNLRREKERLEQEKERLNQEINSSNEENTRLQAALEEKNRDLNSLTDNINNLISELQTLNSEIQDKTSEKNNLKNQIVETNRQISEKEQENSNLSNQKTTLESEINDLETKISDITRNISDKTSSNQLKEEEKNNLTASLNKYKALLNTLTGSDQDNQTISEKGRNITAGLIKSLWDKIDNAESNKITKTAKINELNNKVASLLGSKSAETDQPSANSPVGSLKEKLTNLKTVFDSFTYREISTTLEKRDAIPAIKIGLQDIDGFDGYNTRDTNWHNTIEKNYYLSNMQGAPRFINVIKNNILDYSLEPTSEIFETLKNSNLISSGAKNNSKISIKSRLKISLPNETIQTMLRLNFTKIKVKYKRAHASDNDYRTYEIPLNENTLSDNELHLIEEYNSNPDTSAIGITTVSGRFTHTDRGINYMANEYFIKINKIKTILAYIKVSDGFEILEILDEPEIAYSNVIGFNIRSMINLGSRNSTNVPWYALETFNNDGTLNSLGTGGGIPRIEGTWANITFTALYGEKGPGGQWEPFSHDKINRDLNRYIRKTFATANLTLDSGVNFISVHAEK